MSIISELRALLKSLLTEKYTDPVNFEVFFENGLKFTRDEAKTIAWCYLGAADILKNQPGLGVANAGSAAEDKLYNASQNSLGWSIAGAFRARINELGIGVVRKGTFEDTVELRLSTYLKQYATPSSAARALTPAKRDALRMEAGKLMKPELWEPVGQKYTAIGVRG